MISINSIINANYIQSLPIPSVTSRISAIRIAGSKDIYRGPEILPHPIPANNYIAPPQPLSGHFRP